MNEPHLRGKQQVRGSRRQVELRLMRLVRLVRLLDELLDETLRVSPGSRVLCSWHNEKRLCDSV